MATKAYDESLRSFCRFPVKAGNCRIGCRGRTYFEPSGVWQPLLLHLQTLIPLPFDVRLFRRAMIELSCPHCGKKHKLHEDSSGQRVACQACGKQYKVPGVAKRHKPSSTEPKQTHPSRSNPPPEHSSKTQGFQAADSSRQKNVLLGPGLSLIHI